MLSKALIIWMFSVLFAFSVIAKNCGNSCGNRLFWKKPFSAVISGLSEGIGILDPYSISEYLEKRKCIVN